MGLRRDHKGQYKSWPALTQIKATPVLCVTNQKCDRAGEDDMRIQQIHHVAYRCKDAKETVDFYKRVMNMDLLGAIAEDRVPSTKAPDPYMHIFLDAGAGNILAFFELPNSPAMGRDPNTPDWTQHIAFQ